MLVLEKRLNLAKSGENKIEKNESQSELFDLFDESLLTRSHTCANKSDQKNTQIEFEFEIVFKGSTNIVG